MASDDNEAKPGASGTHETPPTPKPLERGTGGDASSPGEDATKTVIAAETPATRTTIDPATDWTASDARGPLNEAKPLSETGVFADTTADTTAGDRAIPPSDRPVSGSSASGSPVSGNATSSGPTPRGKRASVWPVAAGIVLGAVIGAGSAYYVYTSVLVDPSADKIAILASRVDALDKKPDAKQTVAPLQAALTDLQTKVTAAAAAAKTAAADADAAKTLAQRPPQSAADTTGLAAKVTALETAVSGLKQSGSPDDLKAVRDKIAATDDKIGAVEKASGEQATASGKVAADVKALQDKVTPVETVTAALQKQAAETQATLQSLQAGQKTLEGKITSAPALAVVADSLVSQIKRGLPFTPQVNALEALGVDPAKIALLRQWSDQGVPPAPVLATKFEPIVDGILTAPAPKAAGASPSFLDRMKAGFGGLVSVHRVDDTGGDDLASRIARIKAELAQDDVIGAVATWNALPAEAKARPQAVAWGALAKTHADALATADAVESSAIAALGPKKS